MNRERIIIKTSIIGIIANILLAGVKAIIGLLSHSIAIVLDGVNNLSDALSSVITIIGAKLANKPADAKHPLGHGRIEYMSTMIISVIILYAGVTAFIESLKKIIHPVTPDYTYISLIIIFIGIIIKVILGRYVKSQGEKIHSGSLIASGQDALSDALISSSTLLAAILFFVSHISLEAYLALIISVLIIKSGIELLWGTISQIIGERIDHDLSLSIKECVNRFDEVIGSYDLLLHNYGPDMHVGSIHIEVKDTMNAKDIDTLTRNIQEKVMKETGVILTTVGIYAYNTDEDISRMRLEIVRHVMSHDHILQLHGFYADLEKKEIRFDIIIDFIKERDEIYQHILEDMHTLYPDYTFLITMDSNVSD